MHAPEFLYYAKKAFALFPGGERAVSAPVFAAHYERRRRNRSVARTALDKAIARAFMAWLPGRTRKIAQKFGKDTAWESRTLAIARERFVDPNDIALFGIGRAEELDHYIRRFEDAAFNKIVNPMGWTRHCTLVDKRAFYDRCAETGVPHPVVVAVLEKNRLSIAGSRPRDIQLILKPSHGEGGRGVALVPAAIANIQDDTRFAASLSEWSGKRRGVWLVQQRIANHAALENLAMDALATARMTTTRNEKGASELVSSVLRVPSVKGPVIDNMKAGGLIMPVDLATGRAGAACKGYGGPHIEEHPVSQRRFDELVLPDWNDAITLVRNTHDRVFGEYRMIGWDVAFSPDGPIIVEGNSKPGVLMPQRADRRGLASQRYGTLLAHNLEKAEFAGR